MTPKFRPVLDSDQIAHICELARRDSSKMSMSILASLSSFEWKIKSGAAAPAYAVRAKVDLSSDLGFSEIVQTAAHEVQIETLYSMWADDPSSLNTDQLARVRKYRYENNKMDVKEERAYEKEILGFDIGPT